MATTDKARTEDWKDKYFKALNELDEQERLCGEQIVRVSRDLVGVLERFRGLSLAFDRDLDQLATAGALHDDTQQSRLRALASTLARHPPATTTAAPIASAVVAVMPDPAASLRTLFEHVSGPPRLRPLLDELRARVAPPATADLAQLVELAAALSAVLNEAGENRTLAARDALQVLIDHLSLPEAAHARLGAITPQLQQAQDAATVKKIAKDVADFIVEYVASLSAEVSGLNSFLVVIKSRLGDVSGFIDNEKRERSSATTARETLQQSVQSSLATLRGRVSGAANIEQLKQDIQRQIAVLDGNVSRYLKSEGARSVRAGELEVTLARQLAEFGAETEKLRRQLSQAQAQATRDTLTALPNRLAYNERMFAEFSRWQRGGRELSLVVLDIDKFKVINDTWGHQAGDRVLKLVARELQGQIRAQDFLARYGGEEFVLILPDTARIGALKLADGMRRHIEGCRFKFKDAPVQVTISGGIVQLASGDSVTSAFERADRGLYAAKENGRNRCEVAATCMRARAARAHAVT